METGIISSRLAVFILIYTCISDLVFPEISCRIAFCFWVAKYSFSASRSVNNKFIAFVII